jgi:hypothetical protein
MNEPWRPLGQESLSPLCHKIQSTYHPPVFCLRRIEPWASTKVIIITRVNNLLGSYRKVLELMDLGFEGGHSVCRIDLDLEKGIRTWIWRWLRK